MFFYPDHVSNAIRAQLDQDGVKLKRLHAVTVGRVQTIEDAIWNLRRLADLDAATGAELDRIGYLVGQTRAGRDDDLYRLWIRARSRANRSRGRVDDFFAVLDLIASGTEAFYTDIPDRNAEMQISILGTLVDISEIGKILKPMAGAGIRFNLVSAPTHPFGFIGSSGFGFDDGVFASLI